MYPLSKFSLSLVAVAALAPSLARAQTSTDVAALKKQIDQLQSRISHLEQEKADSKDGAPLEAPASKIKLSDSISELKIYGDVRGRYQYDSYNRLVNTPATSTGAALAGANPRVDQRDRWRLRLRIGADVKLGEQFFAGLTLATGQPSDTNNQTLTEGYDNYNIYVYKAFLGWKPNDWLTVIFGKQANPFYTTDLVWDPDIAPAGFVETIDLSKAFLPENSRLSLQLIALQGAFQDNNEFSIGSNNKTDAWQFAEQLKATYKFNKDTSITFAPGFMTYTAASLTGLQNSLAFSKPQDALLAPNSVQTQTTITNTQTQTIKYDSTGKPSITNTPVNVTTTTTTTDPATGAARTVTTTTTNKQTQVTIPFGKPGNNLAANPALANQSFVSTKTLGGGSTTVTSPVGLTPAGETRDLAIITAPGDISFRLGGVATKLFWDFAYNTEGAARATNEYFLSTHRTQDDFAWLVGLQLGQNVRAGDWSACVSYRQVGIDSIDPNLNDSDFGLSFLNIEGVKAGVAYNFTDACVGSVTYSHATNLRSGVTGGEATGGAQLANAKSVDVLQVDLNIKF